MKKLALVAVAALALAQAAVGLDLRDGRMRVVIDERSGRYALYYLADVEKNRYVPLLYDQETRTTYATLQFDQKTYKLGDASEFRVSVVRQDAGARIEYRSSFCVVRQTLTFAMSPGGSLADGLYIDYAVENVSAKESPVGLRLLFDTWLGEKSAAHFTAASAGALSSETSLAGTYADAWIRSGEESGAAEPVTSLQILLSAPATRPDRVVAANWKRLNDAAWSFDANTSRNYTLLPYSINDSALALYFDPAPVRPGASRAFRTLLSRATDGYAGLAAEPAAGTPLAATAPSDTAPLDERADLVAVRSVLDALNASIASGKPMSAEELAAVEATLQRLEARKAKY